MAIDFDSGASSMFHRIGRILHVAYVLTPFEASLPAVFDDVFSKYLTSLEDVGGAVEVVADQLIRTPSSVMQFAQQTAQQTVVGMVLADQPSQARSLQAALAEVVRQMGLQAKTITANVITITPTVLTGSVGTGILVTSNKRGDGKVNENAIAESTRLVCTSDSYTGSATQGQEQFGLTASAATSGVWDYDYPTGSGAVVGVAAISAEEDGNSNGNLLVNGDVEAWSGTTPGPTATLNNWTLGGSSVWGTDIRQDSTAPLAGTYCLQFLPDTGVNTQIYQIFDDATNGTIAVPKGLFSYAVNVWLRKLSGTVTAGVLTIELVDNLGVVTTDAQGVSNSFTVTLSTLTTSYVAYNSVFRLNAIPPAIVWLRFRMSTALTGASVLMDNMCDAPLTSFYQGGPGFVVFSNPAVSFVGGDGWNIVVANNQGGAINLGTFQTGFQRLFDMRSFNLLLPSASPGNISNTLISA